MKITVKTLNALALIKEDSGINVTMNEVIFDGNTLYMTYTIESEMDLGESPELIGTPSILDSHTRIFGWNNELIEKW